MYSLDLYVNLLYVNMAKKDIEESILGKYHKIL